MGETTKHAAGSTVNSGLPNIVASTDFRCYGESFGGFNLPAGAFYQTGTLYFKDGWNTNWQTSAMGLGFDASRYNSIYGASPIVQPPALFCYMFQRTA